MTDRKKPGVAFWATVVLVCLPLLYIASFGPACWIRLNRVLPNSEILLDVHLFVYRPLYALAETHESIGRAMSWYAYLFARDPEPLGRPPM
jgi:hypothetical protein